MSDYSHNSVAKDRIVSLVRESNQYISEYFKCGYYDCNKCTVKNYGANISCKLGQKYNLLERHKRLLLKQILGKPYGMPSKKNGSGRKIKELCEIMVFSDEELKIIERRFKK